MKNKADGPRARCRAMLSATLLLVLPLAAQKNFHQSEKATVEKFKRARAHYENGLEFLGKNQMERARNEALASMKILPGYPDAHLLLAMIEYRRADYAAALAEAGKAKCAFATMKEFYAVVYQDFIARLREQREHTARRLQEQGLSLILMREAEIRLNAIDEKLREWKPTVELDMPAPYHFVHGTILFKLGRLDEAAAMYRAALAVDPGHANAYHNLMGILLARGDAAGAGKLLRQAEANGVALNEKLKQAVTQGK